MSEPEAIEADDHEVDVAAILPGVARRARYSVGAQSAGGAAHSGDGPRGARIGHLDVVVNFE